MEERIEEERGPKIGRGKERGWDMKRDIEEVKKRDGRGKEGEEGKRGEEGIGEKGGWNKRRKIRSEIIDGRGDMRREEEGEGEKGKEKRLSNIV